MRHAYKGDPIADFYKGKQINWVLSAGAGGGSLTIQVEPYGATPADLTVDWLAGWNSAYQRLEQGPLVSVQGRF